MSRIEITDSGYYNAVGGVLHSARYRCDTELFGKKVGEGYVKRCAEYFEALPENILSALKAASAEYLNDFLEENEGDLDTDWLDEVTAENVMMFLVPVRLTVFPHELLTEEDAPPAFSVKLMFSPVPDTLVEWAVRGDTAVYVGEYREVNPWNEKLRTKRWNYLCEV